MTILLGMLAFPSFSYWITANVSAYTSDENGCLTASGLNVQEGYIACDDLPFGTIVIINGVQYIVEDRFGGGYTHRFDIYMSSAEDANNFGRKQILVEVIV